MRQGKSPKDAGMEALRRIKANTIEKRLLDPKGTGNPNFRISFYVVNKARRVRRRVDVRERSTPCAPRTVPRTRKTRSRSSPGRRASRW